jgi:hypothetical protein
MLISRADSQRWLGRLIQDSFSYEWAHPDPRMDVLHRRVSALVEQAAGRNEDPAETFYRIRELAYAVRGDELATHFGPPIDPARLRPPRLTEAWFC